MRFSQVSRYKSFKVFLWSAGSAIVALAIGLLAEVNVSEQYVALVPVINTILFALKQFIEDNRGTV